MPQVAAALPFLQAAGTVVSAVGGAQSILGGNKRKPMTTSPAQAPAFSPSKPAAIARPSSLSDLSGYDPSQERSALATKGVQGGLGKPEQDYYKNLIQRSLIGDTNEVTGDTNSLLPVESQYFSKQGINTSDIMKFLQQLQG